MCVCLREKGERERRGDRGRLGVVAVFCQYNQRLSAPMQSSHAQTSLLPQVSTVVEL